ncbi:hypothetical protein BD769DRAFT_1304733, partial [Suillus cothurnatus]
LGGFLGFISSFLLAYQHSSFHFWGWSENKQEDLDLAKLSQRAADGKPLYSTSSQPEWVQGAAYQNSAWSQLKFCQYHWSMFNFINHQHHGTSPAKYGMK